MFNINEDILISASVS